MTISALADQLLALPENDRLFLAQRLWESVEEANTTPTTTAEVISLALQRDAELERGDVVAIPHAEVMAAAREALSCR